MRRLEMGVVKRFALVSVATLTMMGVALSSERNIAYATNVEAEKDEFSEILSVYESKAPKIDVVELSSTFTSSNEIEVYLKTSRDDIERVAISGWSGGAYANFSTTQVASYDELRGIYTTTFQLNNLVNTETGTIEAQSEAIYSFDAIVYGTNGMSSYARLDDVQYTEKGFVTNVSTDENNNNVVTLTAEKEGYVAIVSSGDELTETTEWAPAREGKNTYSLSNENTTDYTVYYKAGEEITGTPVTVANDEKTEGASSYTNDDVYSFEISQNSGVADWMSYEETPNVFESTIQGKSGITATAIIEIETMDNGTLSFDYMVSSEERFDLFKWRLMDGETVIKSSQISGDKGWYKFESDIRAPKTGKLTLELTYSKDKNVNLYQDKAAIRNLVYIPLVPTDCEVTIDEGKEFTTDFMVDLQLAAANATYMYISESSEKPTRDDANWLPISSKFEYELKSKENGLKTIYVWFKNSEGSITTKAATDTIKLDNTIPTSTAPIVESFVNEIKITLQQTDANELITKEYGYRKTGEAEFTWIESSKKECVISGLDSKAEYEIKTKVYDGVNPVVESESITVVTKIDASGIVITRTPEEVTLNDVDVTIEWNNNTFTKRYSLDNQIWHDVSSDTQTQIHFNENGSIYYEMLEGSYSTGVFEYVVDNIDRDAPRVESVGVIKPVSGKWGIDDEITIELKWNEDIIVTEAPIMKIRFDDNAVIDLKHEEINGRSIIYKYRIVEEDSGYLLVDSISGGLIRDNLNNEASYVLPEQTGSIILAENIAYIPAKGAYYATIQNAVNAAGMEPTVIQILGNTILRDTVKIIEGQNITIDLNGKEVSIENENEVVTAFENKGTLKIIGNTGVIKAISNEKSVYALVNNNGVLTIEEGLIEAISNTKSKALESYGIYNIGAGKIILGSNDSEINQATPVIKSKALMSIGIKLKDFDGKLEFYDGIIKGTGDSVKAAAGANAYTIPVGSKERIENVTEENVNYIVSYLSNEMAVELTMNGYTTGYLALTDALNKVPADGREATIKMLTDVTLEEPLKIYNGQNVIIDLNNHTLKGTKEINGAIYTIINDGKLILKNGIVEAVTTEWIKVYAVYNMENADLTIDGVKLFASANGIYDCYALYNNATEKVKFFAGEVYNRRLENKSTYLDFAKIETLEEKYVRQRDEEINGQTYNISFISNEPLVLLTQNGVTKGFSSIQSAINDISDSSKEAIITVQDNHELSKMISVPANLNVVIDLNGKVILISNANFISSEAENIEITDTSVEKSGYIEVNLRGTTPSSYTVIYNKSGKLSMKDIDISITYEDYYQNRVYVTGILNSGTLDLKNVEILMRAICCGDQKAISNNSNSVVNIEDSKIEITGNSSISSYDTYAIYSSGIVNVNNSSIKKSAASTGTSYISAVAGIYNAKEVNIGKGVEILGSNGSGIYNSSNSLLNISGDDDTKVYGEYGVYFYNDTSTATVENGKFYGTIAGFDITKHNNVNNTGEYLTGAINIPQGLNFGTIMEGSYVVNLLEEGDYGVEIETADGTKIQYQNLKRAVTEHSADSEYTLKLLGNVVATESIIISAGQNVEINLNGKDIYATGISTAIENNGNLKIKNEGTIKGSAYTIYNKGTGTVDIWDASIEASSYGMYNVSTGTINVNSGNIYGKTYGIYNSVNGTINLIDGTVSSDGSGIYNKNKGTITIGILGGNSDGKEPKIIAQNAIYLAAMGGDINFYEGTLKSSSNSNVVMPANVIFETCETENQNYYAINIPANTCVEDIYDGEFYVKKLTKEYFYKVTYGTTEKYYNSLYLAIKDVPTSTQAIITVLDDAIESKKIEIASNKLITLDLNSNSITFDNEKVSNYINNNGSLTIIDSSTSGGGSIVSKDSSEITYAIYNASNSAKIYLGTNDGTVKQDLFYIISEDYGIYRYSGSIYMYDGLITAKNPTNGFSMTVPSGYTTSTKTNSDNTKTMFLYQSSAINMISENVDWTNDSVKLTIYFAGNQNNQYRIGNGTLQKVTTTSTTIEVTENCTVYAEVLNSSGTVTLSKEYTITNIDKSKPTIGNVVVTNSAGTKQTVTISGALDETNGSGIYGYAVSMDPQISIDSDAWVRINETEFEYDVYKNGTYYVYVRDNAGNISNPTSATVTNIDNDSPIVSNIDVVSPTSGNYVIGTQIKLNVNWSENVVVTEAPVLKLKLGNGEAKQAIYQSTAANVSTYLYTIETDDGGLLTLDSFSEGVVKDTVGNDYQNTDIELIGNKITVDIMRVYIEKTNTYYSTLKEAISTCSNTASEYTNIKLINDDYYNEESILVEVGQKIKIDLNGKKLTVNNMLESIINNGDLIIDDTSSSKSGHVYMVSSSLAATQIKGIVNKSGSLEIKEGTIELYIQNPSLKDYEFEIYGKCIDVGTGVVRILGGNIIADIYISSSVSQVSDNYIYGVYSGSTGELYLGDCEIITINNDMYITYRTNYLYDVYIKDKNSKVVIEGGIYRNKLQDDQSPMGIYIPNDMIIKNDGEYKAGQFNLAKNKVLATKIEAGYLITYLTDSLAVVELTKPNGSKVEYSSLQDAVNNIYTDGKYTIKMLQNEIITKILSIPVGTEVELDLNGKDINIMTSDFSLKNNGNLIIVDNSSAKTGRIVSKHFAIGNYGTLKLGEIKIVIDIKKNDSCGIRNFENAILEISNTDIMCQIPKSFRAECIDNKENAILNFIDGNIILTELDLGEYLSNAIKGINNNGRANMYGGTIDITTVHPYTSAYGIDNTGELNVTGGNIDIRSTYETLSIGNATSVSFCGIDDSGTYLYLNNCIIDIYTGKYSNNTSPYSNALYITKYASKPNKKVIIEGGTYKVSVGYKENSVYSINNSSNMPIKNDGVYEDGYINLPNGKIISTKLEEDYMVSFLSNGSNVVELEKPNGEKENYFSVSEAISAVSGDGKYIIKLMADQREVKAITILAGLDIEIDLNGKDLIFYNISKALINNGNLTIKDTSTNKDGKINFYKENSVVYSISNNEGAKLTIESGNIDIYWERDKSDSSNEGPFVNAGTFELKGGSVDISMGEYLSFLDNIVNKPTGIMNLTGGTLRLKNGGYYAYGILNNGEINISGSEIYINGEGRTGSPYSQNIYNTKTLIMDAGLIHLTNDCTEGIYNTGNFVLNGGKIISEASDGGYPVAITNNYSGIVTINSGEVISNLYGPDESPSARTIVCKHTNSVLNLNGGTIVSFLYNRVTDENYLDMSGVYLTSGSKFNFSGGKIICTSYPIYNSSGSIIVPEGSVSYSYREMYNGDICWVSEVVSDVKCVVTNGETETFYNSLEDAFNKANTYTTFTKIKLLDDVKLVNDIVINTSKNIQLDLNGYTITYDGYPGYTGYNYNFHYTSEQYREKALFAFLNHGTFEITDTRGNGKVKVVSPEGYNAYGVYALNYLTSSQSFKLTGGTLDVTSIGGNAYGVYFYNISGNSTYGDVYVENGHIYAKAEEGMNGLNVGNAFGIYDYTVNNTTNTDIYIKGDNTIIVATSPKNSYGIYTSASYGKDLVSIGEKDGIVNINSPYIKGDTYGIYKSIDNNGLFYDGRVTGPSGKSINKPTFSGIENNTFIHTLNNGDGTETTVLSQTIEAIEAEPDEIIFTDIDGNESIEVSYRPEGIPGVKLEYNISDWDMIAVSEMEEGMYFVRPKGEGNAIITFTATDITGASVLKEVNVISDIYPPTSEAPDATSTGTTVTIISNQTDSNLDPLSIEYAISSDGGVTWSDWGKRNTIAGLMSDTEYLVKTKVSDTTGKTTESEATTIKTKIANKSTFTFEPVGMTKGNVVLTITWNNPENTPQYYKINDGEWINTSEEIMTLTINENNTNIYTKLVYDGNENSEINSILVDNIDRLPPSGTISVNGNGPDFDGNLTLKITTIDDASTIGDNGGAVAYMYLTEENLSEAPSEDDKGWIRYEGDCEAYPYTLSGDTDVTIYAWFMDKVNNVSEVAKAGPFTLTAPVVALYEDDILVGEYNTIADAYVAARTGSTTPSIIKVYRDTTLSALLTIASNKNIVLDLNGKLVTSALGRAIENNGTLEIRDSKEGGTFRNTYTSSYVYTIYNSKTLVISGGTIETINTSTSSCGLYGIYSQSSSASINMTGGKIYINNASTSSSYSTYGIYNTSTYTTKESLNITDGSIEVNTVTSTAYGVYNGNSGIAKMENVQVDVFSKNRYAYGIYKGGSGRVELLAGNVNATTNTTSYYGYGIYNSNSSNNITIGTNDNVVSDDVINIYGSSYGIYRNNGYFKFYDGSISGKAGQSVYCGSSYLELPNNYGTKVSVVDGIETTTLMYDASKPTIESLTITNDIDANMQTITAKNVKDEGTGVIGYYVSTSSTVPTRTSVTWTSITRDNGPIDISTKVSTNGTWYFWVMDAAGNISDTTNVTASGIRIKATGLSISNMTLQPGEQKKIIPTISPSNAEIKSITYTSANENVAYVNSETAYVTGIAVGSTTISCAVVNYDGSTVNYSFTVTVAANVPVILTNPVDRVVTEGTTTDFSVSAYGTNLEYQWYEISNGIESELTEDTRVYKSNIEGQANATASETIVIKTTSTGTLAFDYMVNSELNNDTFTVTVEDANGTTTAVNAISGVVNWTNYSKEFTPTADGEIIITLTYAKNGSIDSGLDCGAIKNLSYYCYGGATVEATYTDDDYFIYTTPNPSIYTSYSSSSHYKWDVATENGETVYRSTIASKSSKASTATITVKTTIAGTLSFDYAVDSEGGSWDWLTVEVIDVNGKKTIASQKGGTSSYPYTTAYTTYSATVTPDANNEVKINLIYRKDSSVNKGLDRGAIKNLKFDSEGYSTRYTNFESDNLFELSGSNWEIASYTGVNTATLTIPGAFVMDDISGNEYYCKVSNVAGEVNSTYASITIADVAEEVETPISKTAPTLTVGNKEITATCNQTGEGIINTWYAISEDNVTYGEWQASNKFTNLTEGKTYYVKTKVATATREEESVESHAVIQKYIASLTQNGSTTYYTKLQTAVNDASTGNPTTASIIKLLDNETSATYINIASGKNIQLDLNGYELLVASSSSSTLYAIYNYATLEIIDSVGNGGITLSSSYSTSNYIYGIYNYNGAKLYFKSGKLSVYKAESYKSYTYGIYNYYGTVTLGSNDGNVSTTMPIIESVNYGLYNYNTSSYFYDGMIIAAKGRSVYGTVNIPQNYCFEVEDRVNLEATYLKAIALDESKAVITTWNIPAANTTIKLPVSNTTNMSLVVDWGDGSAIQWINKTSFPTHKYTAAGTYDIKVSGTSLDFGNYTNSQITSSSNYYTFANYVVGLKQWGEIGAERYGFASCINLTGDIPTPSEKSFEKVTDMSYMFYNCSSLVRANLAEFDTENVNKMDSMFENCTSLRSVFVGENVDKLIGTDMFSGDSDLTAIIMEEAITITNDAVKLGSDTGLRNLPEAVVYVANDVSERMYQKTENYDASLGNERIERLLGIAGNNPGTTTQNSIYDIDNDPGATVAGFDKQNSDEYSVYGYSVETTGLPIDTSELTQKEVTYTLKYTNDIGETSILDSKTRTVKIITSPQLMARDNVDFMLGAYRANNSTTYTAAQATKVVFTEKEPAGATDSWDVSAGKDGSVMSYIVPTTVSGDTQMYDQYIVAKSDIQVISGYVLFYNYENMVGVEGIEKLDTGLMTDISNMFASCKKLESLDLGDNFSTSAVTDTNEMFYYCESLVSLDLGNNFDTRLVTDMGRMFAYCNSLISLELGEQFDTSAVIDMENMFYYCENLTSLDLGEHFDTSSVTTMNDIFYHCDNLTSLDLGDKFDTSVVTTMKNMFCYCTSLTSLDLGEHFYTSEVTTMKNMFYSCESLTSLNLGNNFDTSKVTDMEYMFYYCTDLTSLELGDQFNTSAVTTMKNMFYNCASLTNIDLGENFDTSKVTNMYRMFGRCENLTNLDLGEKFNTSSTTDMYRMFYYCKSLVSLEFDQLFDTSLVTTMEEMFCHCESLTILDLSHFDTSLVTTMEEMFNHCESLTILDLSHFDTRNVTSIASMFNECIALETVILGEHFIKLEGIDIFDGCDSLVRIVSLRPAASAADIMKVTTDNGLGQLATRVLYVPNSTIEGLYEENSTYIALLGADRIKPIMELAGDNPAIVGFGQEYKDAGVTVASWGDNESGDYTSFGFSVVTEGLPLDTSSEGFKEVTYTLKYTNSAGNITTLDTQARTVEVVAGVMLMQRDATLIDGREVYYAIGAGRANKLTYTADKIATITLVNSSTVPADAVDSWDASYVKDSMQVMAWVKANAQDNTKYDLYIGADGGMLAPENSYRLFALYSNCISMEGFEFLNTSRVTNMREMFAGAHQVESLDLHTFDTSRVTNMYFMFSGNNAMESVNVQNWDTSKVIDMSSMFSENHSLKTVDISHFDTTVTKEFSYLFVGCTSMTDLKLPVIRNTSDTINMSSMFLNLSSLEKIKLVTEGEISTAVMSMMFTNMQSLVCADLSEMKVRNISDMDMMFTSCSALETIILGEKFPSINGSTMFGGVDKLERIISMKKVTRDSEILNFGTDTILKHYKAIIYVPDKLSESIYEVNEIYASELGADRISPILELSGDKNVSLKTGETYTESGVTVAGLIETAEYEALGYTTTVTNNVRTDIPGDYEVVWTVYDPTGNVLMSETRNVHVRGVPTPPTITVTQNSVPVESGIWATGDLVVTLSGSTYSEGEFEYMYSIDGSIWNTGNTFEFNTETLSTTIYAKVVGKEYAEDESEVVTFEIKLDKTIPEITAHETIRHDGALEVVRLTVVDGEASSGIVSYGISETSNIANVTWQASNELVIPENGTWYAWVKDAAGNTSAMYTFETSEKYTVEATYGETTEMYVDIVDAIESLELKGIKVVHIKLLEYNAVLNELRISSDCDYVLDLNGQDLEFATISLQVNGKLKIVNSNSEISSIGKNSWLLVDSWAYASDGTAKIITVNSTGELVVDGNIRIYGDDDFVPGSVIEVDGTLKLNDGVIESLVEVPAIYNAGKTIIINGTVKSTSTTVPAIQNNGTLTIGARDAVVSTVSPRIEGGNQVIENNSVLNFFDGRLISYNKDTTLEGSVSELEEGYHLYEEEKENTLEMYPRSNATFIEYWDISETPGVDEVFAGIRIVSGDGVSEDTRYKLVIGGTGRAKDFEVTYGSGNESAGGTHPWYSEYINKIVELDLEEGVTKYGKYMFFNINNVTTITLPESLEELENYACESMDSLSGNVNIPEKLTDIGANPFNNTNVESFSVDLNNTVYIVEEKGLYNDVTKELIAYPGGSKTDEGVVVDGTLKIGSYAFKGNKNLKTVILPETLDAIDGGAFEGAFALEKVTIPEGVRYIRWFAFGITPNLKYVYLKPTEFSSFDTNSTFKNIAPNSIIYTESKEIADLFIPGTTYTAENTKIYYPFAFTSELANMEIERGATLVLTPTIRAGYISDDVSYQWYKDGVAISGATSATYTKAGFTDSDVGAYKLVVSSAMQEDGTYYYNVESNVARFTMGDFEGPEEINSSITYNEDGSATITITAKDKETGVDQILVNDVNIEIEKDEERGSATGSFNVTDAGDYVVKAVDGAGNETEITITAYEITYMPNSDQYTGETLSQIKIKNADIRIRESGYRKVGYEAKMWNTNENGTGTVYKPNDLYTGNANITLYATWSVKEYVVRFYNDNGINGQQLVSEATYPYGATITVPEEQYKTATEIDGDKYRIYYHNNNWTGEKVDANSTESVISITNANKGNITMIDSDVNYYASYTYTEFNTTESTVRLEGNTQIIAGTIGIDNIEGLIILGQNSTDASKPTISGAISINNDNGIVLWYHAGFIGPVKGLIAQK